MNDRVEFPRCRLVAADLMVDDRQSRRQWTLVIELDGPDDGTDLDHLAGKELRLAIEPAKGAR